MVRLNVAGMETSSVEHLRVKTARIEVVRGRDVGRCFDVDRPVLRIGSGPEADLQLSDPSVSLRILATPDGLFVKDEGSAPGVFVGPLRVVEAMLAADTTLELGESALLVRFAGTHLDLPLSSQETFGDVAGTSVAMRHVFALLEQASASDGPVWLQGETGTGRGALARALHDLSPRSRRPFVSVDSSALEALGPKLASAVEQARGGSLFLHEIDEPPTPLVDLLQGRGAHDVRIIVSSHLPLDAILEVLRVPIPPLRDRREDVLFLATRFLRGATRDPEAEVPADLAPLLVAYDWPGNVRELWSVVQRHLVLGRDDAPDALDLGAYPYREARRRALAHFERTYLASMLQRAGGVVSKAATLAGVARPSFYRMLDRARSRES